MGRDGTGGDNRIGPEQPNPVFTSETEEGVGIGGRHGHNGKYCELHGVLERRKRAVVWKVSGVVKRYAGGRFVVEESLADKR